MKSIDKLICTGLYLNGTTLLSDLDYVLDLGFDKVKNLIYNYMESLTLITKLTNNKIALSHDFIKDYKHVYAIKIVNLKIENNLYYYVVMYKKSGTKVDTLAFALPLYVLKEFGEISIGEMRVRTLQWTNKVENILKQDMRYFFKHTYPYGTVYPTKPIGK